MVTNGHKLTFALRLKVQIAGEGTRAPICAERRPQTDSKPEQMIEANRDAGLGHKSE